MRVSNNINHKILSFTSLNNVKTGYSVARTAIGICTTPLESIPKLGHNNIKQIKCVKSVDIPIITEEEYNQVINRILCAKKRNGYDIIDKNMLRTHYSNIAHKELGLLPYCGGNDVSCNINLYLSGRLRNPVIFEKWKAAMLPENLIIDIIRALDYSLKFLDRNFGKYRGIVFRQGFMDENVGQYFSTSKKSAIAGQLNNNWLYFKPDRGYSVIRTSKGHNIYEFQKNLGVEFATTEEEILIPRTDNFRKVKESEMDKELIEGRNMLASKLFAGADKLVDGSIKECNGYTKKDLFRLINVFDE